MTNLTANNQRMTRYRWVICALLFCATSINYIDRQILSLLKPILDDQLHWTSTQFGFINSCFQGAYAVGLVSFGWFIDRFGSKIGYAVSITAWSIAAMAHALVGSVGGFVSSRIALGLSEGGNFPCAIKTVALWFPKRERAFATSIFNSGSNISLMVAPAFVPWIALHWGWQAAFIAAGLAGFAWLLFWIPFYDVPERIKRLSDAERAHIRSDTEDTSREEGKVRWLSLLRYPQTWSFIIAQSLTDPVWWFFMIWLPDYFKQTRHLDIRNSAGLLVTIYSIVTVLSIAGSWMTGALAKSGWSVTRARKTGMFLFALCVLPMLVVTQVGNWTAVLLFGLAGAAHQAWSANLYTTVSDMFPKHAVASVVGIGGLAGGVSAILFPLITGMVLDHSRATTGSMEGGYKVMLAVCAFLYLVAFALNHLCAPRYESFELKDTTAVCAE